MKPTDGRALSQEERALAASIFGAAINYDAVRLHARPWWPFQPRAVVMAPDGHIWCHAGGALDHPELCATPLGTQGLFIHEMTHVWQAQTRGRWWLPLMRHPFCRYDYALEPGRPFHRYGIEQQAEIVRHAFLARRGVRPDGAPEREALEGVLPFGRGKG